MVVVGCNFVCDDHMEHISVCFVWVPYDDSFIVYPVLDEDAVTTFPFVCPGKTSYILESRWVF
jgi:hypothetical protein